MPSSHALLLRLFLSQSFFDLHVALKYLLIYADNIGITYYLTSRLKLLQLNDLYDNWGFICHLLLTRPSKSRAIESFVVETAERSTHIAMVTLWYMQAHIRDLSSTNRESQAFVTCQKVLNRCQEIIFGDIPRPVSSPYGGLSIPFNIRRVRRKVKPNVEPVLVGIGISLAGAPGLPQVTKITGPIAIEQGRAEDSGAKYRAAELDDGDALFSEPVANKDSLQEDLDVEEVDSPISTEDPPPQPLQSPTTSVTSSLSRRRTIGAAQTVPALPLHLQSIRRSRASEDPLGQLDADENAAPSRSSPSLPLTLTSLRPIPSDPASATLQKYNTESQMQMLRNHYCLSEVQFLLNLESISNRLLVVPKPARVSALRAELTMLNHKLPAEVCMPMWCSSSDSPHESNGIPQPHHRVVRIPPGESVVLNSAERAPYLLLIEILDNDLDFDPGKRANKEVLKKIVLKEEERKGASRDLIRFNRPSTPLSQQTRFFAHDVRYPEPPVSTAVIPPSPIPSQANAPEEEVDLVEQVLGADKPVLSRHFDLSESIILPPTPKNKELDMVTWSRTPSMPSTPALESASGSSRLPALRSDGSQAPSSANVVTIPSEFASQQNESRVISLDEYSERMRTAAIMLTQLNANLARETIIPGVGSPSIPLDRQNRMKLQYSETSAIRERIMEEMLALEEERMERMRDNDVVMQMSDVSGSVKTAEDESIIRSELNKADPSAVVFSESWAAKKSRIRHASPYGHLANWDCVSVIVKTGGDLRQEQLAVQLIREFQRIWTEESCLCWVRYFRIFITGATSGLVETITDAVSIHSIKKSEYAKRLAEGRFGHVTLMDHFKSRYGDPSSAKFARAQRNLAKSLAGYSIITYLLQIKDRHNGNILLDRDGHIIHIDFGFILGNTPGNIGFEAAPFKLPPEYIDVLGGVKGAPFVEFKRLFHQGFEAARKHCDRIITLVELMQKDSSLPCFATFGEQTSHQLRDRFQPTLTHSLVGEYVNRLIDTSLGSNWTRLYDSYQYYSQSIL